MLKFAGTKYVGICDGIPGKMGELVIDPNWDDEIVSIPIDTLMVDLTQKMDNDGEMHDGANLRLGFF